jgi:hypothetical protein
MLFYSRNGCTSDGLFMRLQGLFHVFLWCTVLSHAFPLLPPPQGGLPSISELPPPPPLIGELHQPFWILPLPLEGGALPDTSTSTLNGWEIRYLYAIYRVQKDEVVGFRSQRPPPGWPAILDRHTPLLAWADFLRKISPGQPAEIYESPLDDDHFLDEQYRVNIDAISERLHRVAERGVVRYESIIKFASGIFARVGADVMDSVPGEGYSQEQHEIRMKNLDWARDAAVTNLSDSIKMRMGTLAGFFDEFTSGLWEDMRAHFPHLPLRESPFYRAITVRDMAHPPRVLRQGTVEVYAIDWYRTLTDLVSRMTLFGVTGIQDVILELERYIGNAESRLYAAQDGEHVQMMRSILAMQKTLDLISSC